MIKEGKPITDITQVPEVRKLWESLFEYPIDLSVSASRVGGPIGEVHQERLQYFFRIISPKKYSNTYERD